MTQSQNQTTQTPIQVAILMGSRSDESLVIPAADLLQQLGIAHEVRVLSAHRTPADTAALATSARERGIRVFICAAGGAAHLAGAVAAHTTLPVIGLPLARTPLAGQDALLATVQMPRGMPVATVAIDGAYNAALLAAQILATADEALAQKLVELRQGMADRVRADDSALRSERAATSA
ncbi:5-(carboxyamino)imidazole ribonucleotide mutase [Haliangium ochraceum]|uniref:N5-carboxyaminoimidazole ribonucleotide mutase n=1 Tax=Haliangium ochraceum (strain DSM 14365 / JCM 11303 / SMP-2) TaxID=502025 RepID=D0LU44_HALO1|nr:5-(carboxyamino)imidazole ribonucleotide mutase [Haliangium ochraceum]ACY17408.1 phosphoribosylaminoimidazole carboxylase, catalytic subunit [Haliangium ochraceum DSM 14365]